MHRVSILSVLLLLSACRTDPGTPSVTLSPSSPTTVDDIVASVDNCGDCQFRWFKDGVRVVELDGETVGADLTAKGEVWSVLVTSLQEDGSEGLPGEAATTVVNSNPEFVALSVTPDEVYTDDLLIANVETSDADGDEVALRYQWAVDGEAVGDDADSLDGLNYFSRGEQVVLTVTASDGDGETQEAIEAIEVLNTPPGTPEITLGITGQDAWALRMDGVDDYVALTDADVETLGDFTMEAWVSLERTDPNDDWQVVMASTCGVVQANPATGELGFGVWHDCSGSGDYSSWESQAAVVAGEWQHIAITHERNSAEGNTVFFLNGQEYAISAPSTSSTSGNTHKAGIGALAVQGQSEIYNPTLAGQISGVRYSDGIRYTADFQAASLLTKDTTTVALYPLDEGTGQTTYEADGALSGQIQGAKWVNDAPWADSSMLCSITTEAVDADEDELTYSFSWELNGNGFTDTESTAYEGDTVPDSALELDQTWTCTVISDDGEAYGEPATAEMTIDGTCKGLQSGVQLDGAGDWVNVSDLSLTGDRTLEFWLLWEPWRAPAYDPTNLFGIENAWHQFFGGNCSAVSVIAGQMSLLVFPGCNGTSSTQRFDNLFFDDSAFDEGWVHVAVVSDGSTKAELFLNGELAAVDSQPRSDSQSGRYNGGIGAWTNDNVNSRFTPLTIAEFRMSDSLRYTAPFEPVAGMQSDADTVLLYNFNEGIGTTINDQSSNNKSATLVGGTWIDACEVLEDGDGDGYAAWQECDDFDGNVYPMAGDFYGDGVDSDCDGMDCEADFTTSGAYFAVCAPGSFPTPAWSYMAGACRMDGYEGLASVQDATENEELRQLGLSVPGMWGVAIGGNDDASEGDWVWSDGSDFDYSNWGNGHYGGGSSENCIEMDLGGSGSNSAGSWNDCSCDWVGSTTGFACQSRP